jgi:prolyl-tRNA synthetase
MKQSQLFTKTRREAPKDEVSKNAQLLIRAGYIHKEMAGVYAYLPLGLRVQNKIKEIVREEMNKIGGQELIMTSLQRKELWEKTKRWDDKVVDVWFKSELKAGGEVGFGWSHEEPITEMMKNYIASFRDCRSMCINFKQSCAMSSSQERHHARSRVCHEGHVLVLFGRRGSHSFL